MNYKAPFFRQTSFSLRKEGAPGTLFFAYIRVYSLCELFSLILSSICVSCLIRICIFFCRICALFCLISCFLISQAKHVSYTILLSQFTDDYPALLVGVNIGGAGTLVASLASLITFREYTKHVKGQTGRFLALFSAVSFGFLAVLLAAMTFWMQ